MREYQVRHVPVLDEQDCLVGLITQKVVLKEALRIADAYGTEHLKHHLMQVPLSNVVHYDFQKITSDTCLAEAGRLMLANKQQGALLIVDEERLVGILSSVDFVRIAVHLLEAGQVGEQERVD